MKSTVKVYIMQEKMFEIQVEIFRHWTFSNVIYCKDFELKIESSVKTQFSLDEDPSALRNVIRK